jgi:hypothetical protein
MAPIRSDSGQTVPLFTPAPPPPGPQRKALETTIRAWRRRKHLTGAEHAATLEFLRGLADQLDRGWAPQTARTYREALELAAPPPAPASDPRADALAAEAERVLADLGESPE